MSNLPFGFDGPEDSPGFLLWQTTMTWQRLIRKALDAYKISHAQFVIMATLLWFEAHKYDTTQVLIATQTKLDKMTVSKALKEMTKLGYVKRIEHETDTRAKCVTLTPKGKDMVRILVPIVEGIDERFFSVLEDDEERGLISALRKLSENS